MLSLQPGNSVVEEPRVRSSIADGNKMQVICRSNARAGKVDRFVGKAGKVVANVAS